MTNTFSTGTLSGKNTSYQGILSIKEQFQHIISFLMETETLLGGVSPVPRDPQFYPSNIGEASVLSNLTAAFCIVLSGPSAYRYQEALRYLNDMKDNEWAWAADFLLQGLDLIDEEIEGLYNRDADFRDRFDRAAASVGVMDPADDPEGAARILMGLFFPEGIVKDRAADIDRLRQKRRVSITGLNDHPLASIERELLITSNILLTIPKGHEVPDDGTLDQDIAEKLKKVVDEDQLYWYDHPVQIGTSPESNEVIYGLKHLSDALVFEERRGTKDPGTEMTCLLSVSVTHRGLHGISRPYIEKELRRAGGIRGLMLYVFTESDTDELLERVLKPASRLFCESADPVILDNIFGVDGEYGRHYSFLKAIAAFWQVFISTEVRATFKIDLDQVFPQDELVKETGRSAFQHFMTPLWGARGSDSNGRPVSLGMIAGALVNQRDIGVSIFTPDIPFPETAPRGDELVFRSSIPQALSTEAEMMTRYEGDAGIDGREWSIQRVHVTGGTNGILVEHLRRYRPFTPSVIGRAEDQSYIMSVLFSEVEGEYLRYHHGDGLVMRHDKEAFAAEAIESARIGKMIGDYIRILLFSFYARALPWGVDDIKAMMDPFTGSFISKIPLTVVYLRFVLKAAMLLGSGDENDGVDFYRTGVLRIVDAIKQFAEGENSLKEIFKRENKAWNLYYDILDAAEKKISEGDPFVKGLAEEARSIISQCMLKL